MNLNGILILMTGGATVLSLVHLTRAGVREHLDWLLISAGSLLVLLLMLVLVPHAAGYLGFGVWFAVALLPSLLARLSMSMSTRQKYGGAIVAARLAACLHPSRSWRRMPELTRALQQAHAGDTEAARARLHPLQDAHSAFGRMITAQIYRLDNDWEGLVDWLDCRDPDLLRQDVTLLSLYIRGLGEVGRTNEMVHAYLYFEAVLQRQGGRSVLLMCRLFLLAFGGRRESVYYLLEEELREHPLEVRMLWFATAELAATGESATLAQLAARTPDDRIVTLGVKRRRDNPPPLAVQALDEEARELLDRIETELEQTQRYGDRLVVQPGKAHLTVAICGLLMLVYLGQELTRGGLTIAGALVLHEDLGSNSVVVVQGQLYRFFTANFLHANTVHLFMNLVGLYVFGPFVEYAMGRWRYLLTYLGSGIGGMFFVWLAAWLWAEVTDPAEPLQMIVLGASACVMGMLGANVSILWRGWLQERARPAWRRLLLMLSILLLQAVFDQVNPQVSATAHAGGALMGFLFGWSFRLRI